MHVENGRIYHPCTAKTGSIGLVASKLAIEFSKSFTFDDDGIPTHFRWKDKEHKLCSQWFEDAQQQERPSWVDDWVAIWGEGLVVAFATS